MFSELQWAFFSRDTQFYAFHTLAAFNLSLCRPSSHTLHHVDETVVKSTITSNNTAAVLCHHVVGLFAAAGLLSGSR